MISYQPDASNPLNPANRDQDWCRVIPNAIHPCDWAGCPNDAHAPGALCDACQAEADAAAPDEPTLCASKGCTVDVKHEGETCMMCQIEAAEYRLDRP